MTLSTRNLGALPDIDSLKKLLQSLAVLDLIISPEWEDRFYSFNAKWSEYEQMGSMRNGCGDEFFALFNEQGCFVKGFDHECAMSSWATEGDGPWPGVLESVSAEFTEALNEPAFSIENISFCIWRLNSDESWQIGEISFVDDEDPDGSEYLLRCLEGNPETYQSFASEYFETNVPISVVKHVYNHLPLNDEIIAELNSEVSLAEISEELEEIGYPSRTSI